MVDLAKWTEVWLCKNEILTSFSIYDEFYCVIPTVGGEITSQPEVCATLDFYRDLLD